MATHRERPWHRMTTLRQYLAQGLIENFVVLLTWLTM